DVLGLAELVIAVVLRLAADAAVGQAQIDAAKSGHTACQQQSREPDHLGPLGDGAVDECHDEEEHGIDQEDHNRRLHLADPPISCPSDELWPATSSSARWMRSTAGRSERIRGHEVEL